MQVAKKQNINKLLLSLLFIAVCAFNKLDAQTVKSSYFGNLELYNPIKHYSIKGHLYSSKKQMTHSSIMSLNVPKPMPVSFFCVKEHYMDKKNRINPRFRLGSVDYVNYLEGKLD